MNNYTVFYKEGVYLAEEVGAKHHESLKRKLLKDGFIVITNNISSESKELAIEAAKTKSEKEFSKDIIVSGIIDSIDP